MNKIEINLKMYKQKKARLRLVINELNKITNTITEIEADSNMASQYALNSDIRSKNKVGNKVLAIVIEKDNIDNIKKEKIIELEKEKAELEYFIEDIDSRISILSEEEKRLIISAYINKKSLTEIANNMYMARSSIYRKIQNAIEKMAKI